MSDALPVLSEEIVGSALEAAEAGAAIVHLHARDQETGQPDQTVAAFEPIIREISAQNDVVITITTGGSPS